MRRLRRLAPRPSAILGDELDAGSFEEGADGGEIVADRCAAKRRCRRGRVVRSSDPAPNARLPSFASLLPPSHLSRLAPETLRALRRRIGANSANNPMRSLRGGRPNRVPTCRRRQRAICRDPAAPFPQVSTVVGPFSQLPAVIAGIAASNHAPVPILAGMRRRGCPDRIAHRF
jgi:hypothetical protein